MLAVADQPEQVEPRLLKDVCDARHARTGCSALGGFARERELRHGSGCERRRFRRSRCRVCKATHVLVPTSTLLRRLDDVEIIGAALLAKARGRVTAALPLRLGYPPLQSEAGFGGSSAERQRSGH